MSAEVYSNTNKEETKVGSAVRRLTLVNFRNYKYLRLNLAQPFVILSGENGSGKTNVLEAVSFLSQGRGLRNAKLSEIKTFDFLADKQKTPVLSTTAAGLFRPKLKSRRGIQFGHCRRKRYERN